jgi:hypothetical protein
MTTPYVYIYKEKEKEPEDTTTYFWGSVIALLLIAGVVIVIIYGLQSSPAADAPSVIDRAVPLPAMLTQLPLYIGSTQYSDPPEDV